MTSRPLKVLLVSADRDLLRQTGRLLRKFGYEVDQAVSPTRAAAVLAGDRPDFLILDGDIATSECIELCRAAGGDRRRKYVFTFLVAGETQPRAVTEAIQAGVDDFLSRPLVYGEVLARLRAGARVLEYERRVREQTGWDPLTGLLSRSGLIAKARGLAVEGPRVYSLLAVDHLDSMRHSHGERATHEVVEAVAAWLDQVGAACELLAYCGDGQFAALLRATDEKSALQWADQVCRAARGTEFACGGAAARMTLSVGLAIDPDGLTDIETSLGRAGEALALAQHSGRDGVATYDECMADDARWNQLARTGQLFERTLARHVMTPNTLTLRPEDALGRAVALFRQTGLQAIPVIDALGALQGIVARRVMASAAEDGLTTKTVADAMTSEVTRFDESTSMDALMEHFLGTDDALAVIVNGDAPTGIVSRRNLRTLIEPLSNDTFAPRSPFVSTSDYLLVPDLCPAASY